MHRLPVRIRTPEWSRQKLYKGSHTNQDTTLSRIHAHLLEIDSHQREKGAKGCIEEEIETLHRNQFLFGGSEEFLNDVSVAAYFIGGLFWFRIPSGYQKKNIPLSTIIFTCLL